MQFDKNSSTSRSINFTKTIIRLIVIISILFFTIFLIDKIDFPSPNKNIEKKIPNEKFKVIK